MSRILSACRSVLLGVAAVVLVSACGASEEGGPDSAPDSAAGSATAESSAEAADARFCADAAELQERLTSTLSDQTDPAALPQALQQAAAEIREVEAPAEIAADWTALADGVEQMATAFASTNPDDPSALAALQQQLGQLQGKLATASTNVEDYLSTQCA